MARRTDPEQRLDYAIESSKQLLIRIFDVGRTAGQAYAENMPREHLFEYLPGYNEDGRSVCGRQDVNKTDDLKNVTCQRCLMIIQSRLPG